MNYELYFRTYRTNLLPMSFLMLKLNFDKIRHQLNVGTAYIANNTKAPKWLFQESTNQRNIGNLSTKYSF